MLATIRPEAWNFPLFVHVLGAIALFGTTLAAAVLAWAGPRAPQRLAGATFGTLLAAVVPSWVVMRIGAQLIASKESYDPDPGWLTVGVVVAEPGLVLLLVAAGLAFWSTRRAGEGWQLRAVAALTSLYVAALLVAMWAMSAKP